MKTEERTSREKFEAYMKENVDVSLRRKKTPSGHEYYDDAIASLAWGLWHHMQSQFDDFVNEAMWLALKQIRDAKERNFNNIFTELDLKDGWECCAEIARKVVGDE